MVNWPSHLFPNHAAVKFSPQSNVHCTWATWWHCKYLRCLYPHARLTQHTDSTNKLREPHDRSHFVHADGFMHTLSRRFRLTAMSQNSSQYYGQRVFFSSPTINANESSDVEKRSPWKYLSSC